MPTLSEISFEGKLDILSGSPLRDLLDLHETMEEHSIPKVELVDPTTLAFKTRGAQHLPCYLLDTHSVNENFRGCEDILKLLADKLLLPKNRVAALNPALTVCALRNRGHWKDRSTP